MEEDEAKAKGDESEIPAGLSAAMFVGLIIASAALLSLLLTIIYDYADQKNVMIVAKITPNNTRHSSWTVAWFWSKISGTGSGFAPWEYFVKKKSIIATTQPSLYYRHVRRKLH